MRAAFPVSYCMNAHSAADLPSLRETLERDTLAIKDRIAPEQSFPLSLYLGFQPSLELAKPRQMDRLRDWLHDHDCFIAGLNAFPYGDFHADLVKTNVYHPDWRTAERLQYTFLSASLLADLTPGDAGPTLTTVPGGWLPDWHTRADRRLALKNLAIAAAGCREINETTKHRIRIAIEPEPGCTWELFDPRIEEIGPELCWCLDTCHAAVEFRSIEHPDWARIGRVQLSAAIECDNTPEARDALAPFVEPVYLHQTRAAIDGEIIGAWEDLGPALEELPALPANAVVRTHYHVPLTWEGHGPLRSTRHQLTPLFFRQIRDTPCEVETYTYSVLPENLRPRSVVRSIADELQWAAAGLMD